MRMQKFRSSPAFVAVFAAAAVCLAACASQPSPRSARPAAASTTPPDTIIINTNIVTLAAAPAAATAEALAITGGKITAIGTTAAMQALVGPNTVSYTPPAGTTLLPGFIDPHSHMSAVGFYSDTAHWTDVSGANLLFKPLPGSKACTEPTNPQVCFIPVQTQDDVNARLTTALSQVDPSSLTPYVLAFNYDPARLGKSSGCSSGVSFQCTTFENGQALAQLNAISNQVPIMVASQSGHIAYVNTPALTLLNICGTPGAISGCYQPTTNPTQETQLANLGQLDEDLALYAISFFQTKILDANKGLGASLIQKAATIYAQHGYTVAQEGAAAASLMALYFSALDTPAEQAAYPLTMAIVAYDATSSDYTKTINAARAGRVLFGKNPLLNVAAVKTFADGSPQGFTAWLSESYLNLYNPFTDPNIFQQPYTGLPDVTQSEMTTRLTNAHQAGFPMLIHQNGDAATTAALAALAAAPPPPAGTRDVVVHAPMITPSQLAAINPQQVTVSFLLPNVYYWGLPECQQIIGAPDTVNMYPVATAAKSGVNFTLHTDSPVTPPAPLFAIWAAARRYAQQPSWYPNTNPANCPPTMVSSSGTGNQTISIAQAVQAYTVNAAWQYGMEATRGTLEVNKFADIVMLSANPLSMQDNVDQLSTIQIVGTYSQGRRFMNAAPTTNWPEQTPGN
ncbi:putative amidohydrolase YtcJ [Tahibacter aquaticus]|uniref:Putative amidohydrolase YtcJ n=1 Tax=Tahibacter aquaticus TaxID=520092 RepID=A0A4R6Z2N8_9GAMM|nr:amidohydrolase family protein [Tahibacter aquaticus]TDR45853.1 putative amidohydrolase YtcJ [Tahibacter aquaticus]